MPQAIYMQLGDKDSITLNALVSALRSFLGVLEDVDSAISGQPNGSVRWEVLTLEKKSPTTIGVIAHPKEALADLAPRIEAELIDGLAVLSYAAERRPYYSDAVLSKIQRLAQQSKSLGRIRVYTGEKNGDGRQTFIDQDTLKNIHELTGSKEQALGSVTGNLDAITVHRANEFRVWDEYSGRPVTCRFTPDMEDEIKTFLRKRVWVNGLVYFNQAGQPTAVNVDGIELATPESSLPTIEEMSGLVDDFTDGMPLGEYLEDLRDG